jgi:protein TonB
MKWLKSLITDETCAILKTSPVNIRWLKLFTLIILIITVLCNTTRAQDHNQSRLIEKMPVFMGEEGDFLKYVSDNLIYPEVAKTLGFQVEVMVSFTVNTDGTVSDVKALSKPGGGCDSEAVRVVSLSPPWKPALYNGKPVKITASAPVDFSLDKKDINKTIAHLKKSPYGFLFLISGMICTLDEMETKFGKLYDPSMIDEIKKYNNPKYAMPDKTGVYLIFMKNNL